MSRLEFKPNKEGILLPEHEIPKLHADVMKMSFENCFFIKKAYKEIIGLRNVSHFSINIVDPDDKMSIISLNPHIAFNICADGSYLYNGSISPTYYKTRDIYSWDECYDTRFSEKLKNNMERKNGIHKGVVVIRRFGKFIILYSFATKFAKSDFTLDIQENLSDFYDMGDHCYSLIQNIYEQYAGNFEPPKVGDFQIIESNVRSVSQSDTERPKLKIIKGGKSE